MSQRSAAEPTILPRIWISGFLHHWPFFFQLNNSHVQQVQELRSALEQEAALLAAGNCTEKDALDLRSILAQLESSEDEKARAGLDKKLHTKIGRIAGNPMIYNVLDAAAQLTEEIISGTRAYIMQKHNSALEVDDQHRRLVGSHYFRRPEPGGEADARTYGNH